MRSVYSSKAYDRVRFAYLTAAVALVVAAGCAATVKAWFVLPVAAVLLALTIWYSRRVLGRIKRGDFLWPRLSSVIREENSDD